MDLKEKVKNSLLFSSDLKKKILSIKWPLPPKLVEEIENIFEKYWSIERKIVKTLPALMWKMYIKTIQDLEKLNKEKENQELKKLEEKLLKIK